MKRALSTERSKVEEKKNGTQKGEREKMHRYTHTHDIEPTGMKIFVRSKNVDDKMTKEGTKKPPPVHIYDWNKCLARVSVSKFKQNVAY